MANPAPLCDGDVLSDSSGGIFVVEPSPDLPTFYLRHVAGLPMRYARYETLIVTLPATRIGCRANGRTLPDDTVFTELPERLPG